MLDAKAEKPQFWQCYIKDVFRNKISPGTASGADLSKINAFLLMFPPKHIDLILKLINHNLSESGEKLLTKIMLFISLEVLCYSIVLLYTIGDGFGEKQGSGHIFPLLHLTGLGLNLVDLMIFGDI